MPKNPVRRLGLWIGQAVAILIAHARGAAKDHEIAPIVRAGYAVALLSALPLMILLWFAGPLLRAAGEPAAAIIEREGLKAMSDTGELERIAQEIIAANPKQVEQYRGGKTSVIQFFVGQVMKATRGQANPATASEILKRLL